MKVFENLKRISAFLFKTSLKTVKTLNRVILFRIWGEGMNAEEYEIKKLKEEIRELKKIVATLVVALRRYEVEYGAAKWAERYWRWGVANQEYI